MNNKSTRWPLRRQLHFHWSGTNNINQFASYSIVTMQLAAITYSVSSPTLRTFVPQVIPVNSTSTSSSFLIHNNIMDAWTNMNRNIFKALFTAGNRITYNALWFRKLTISLLSILGKKKARELSYSRNYSVTWGSESVHYDLNNVCNQRVKRLNRLTANLRYITAIIWRFQNWSSVENQSV